MSINFGQFPTPRLPLIPTDVVVGYQVVTGVPTLAQYTLLQLAGALGPIIGALSSTNPVVLSGTLTPTQLGGIVGTTTNNNANAGSVGEHITATGTSVALTNNTAANITSISLTAGDWEVSSSCTFIPAGTTTTSSFVVGSSNVSATFPGDPFTALLQANAGAFMTGAKQSLAAPSQRFSLSGTTTVFLVAQAGFAVSTLTATGTIRARRVR